MEDKVTNKEFFKTWKEVCEKNRKTLLAVWDYPTSYTDVIFKKTAKCNASIIDQIATKIEHKVFYEYYHFDTVFYRDGYFVDPNPPNNTWGSQVGYWLRKIHIAFEHENALGIAYQEISHLLTTESETKVLVTYVVKEEDAQKCATDFDSILKDLETTSILLILGYREEEKIRWKGYELSGKGAKEIVCPE